MRKARGYLAGEKKVEVRKPEGKGVDRLNKEREVAVGLKAAEGTADFSSVVERKIRAHKEELKRK